MQNTLKCLGFTLTKKEKYKIYWILKMHKTLVSFRFFITFKLCSAKKISKPVSHIFKLIYSKTGNFHKNSKYLSSCNKLWVLQDSDPLLDSLNKINKKKSAKSIVFLHFTTKYYMINQQINFTQSVILHLKEVINPKSEYQKIRKHFGERKLKVELEFLSTTNNNDP